MELDFPIPEPTLFCCVYDR